MSQKPNLLTLLRYFGPRKASDDRDRVYALMGLCNEATAIQPDYSLDVTKVYMAPILEAIRNSKSLSVLYGDHSRKGRQDLPSWVPDWSTARDENEHRRITLSSLYDACGSVIPILITDEASKDELIKKEMVLLLDSLMAERYPGRLLREELASKLRCENIQSTTPIMQAIKHICKRLANYCHKDGRRDLPKYSLIWHEGKSLMVNGMQIGTVCKITEPLYASVDINTAAKVLYGWKRVAETRPVEHMSERFLKTVMSDAKKTPNGFLGRPQDNDTAILEKWLTGKISQGFRGEDEREAVESTNGALGRCIKIMRFSTTNRTLFFIDGQDSSYYTWQKWLDAQNALLTESSKLLDTRVDRQAHLELSHKHMAVLEGDTLGECSGFIEHDKNAIENSAILKELHDTCRTFLNDRKAQFHVPNERFIPSQRMIILRHMNYLNQRRFPQYEHIGLGPMLIKESDEIYILPGSRFPLVLRPVNRQEPRKYQLVGDCFLNGAMDGELGSIGGNILDYIDHLQGKPTKTSRCFDTPVPDNDKMIEIGEVGIIEIV